MMDRAPESPRPPAVDRTLVDVLRRQARERGQKTAYTFLVDGDSQTVSLTYEALDRRARTIAARVAKTCRPGDRAVLLYPAGLDYITAFFGCLYAGVVAVPAYPPLRSRGADRIDGIVRDCGARTALLLQSVHERIADLELAGGGIGITDQIITDRLDDGHEAAWVEPELAGSSLAFLQYTSGSTGDPKGVMVSHDNLLANEAMIQQAFRLHEDSVIVGWLPLYHDMGLIGTVFQPLWLGATAVLMSPVHFLQRPQRWLDAMSRHRGTCSGGPDFAYDLCARKITAEQRSSLDLSAWEVAFNGAEPVREETLERFTAAFSSCGFRRQAFEPCYGLAEATLIVSGGRESADPTVEFLSRGALEKHRLAPSDPHDTAAKPFVGCGRPLPGGTLAIVEPATRRTTEAGQVGEIWIRGPHVASGYWNRPDENERTFGGRRSDVDDGPWLRTGDLGFLRGGEVFIVGRLKDLIIIRGRNIHPQDVKRVVERSHVALRPNCGAASAVDKPAGESLVCVQEIDVRQKDRLGEALESVRAAVVAEVDVQPCAVVLVGTGGVPKTSSGKVRRRLCRELFLTGGLETLAEWRRDAAEQDYDTADAAGGLGVTEGGIHEWIVGEVARRLGMDRDDIRPESVVADLGLDSLAVLELCHAVEARCGVELPMARLLDGMTFREMVAWVEAAPRRPAAAVPSPAPGALTEGERAMWFLHRLDPCSAAYDLAGAARVIGPLDVEALDRAVRALTAGHAALRTTFVDESGAPRRRVASGDGLGVRQSEIDSDDWQVVGPRLLAVAFEPFDLGAGPLFRVDLLTLRGGDQVMIVGLHHAICDLWSVSVLFDELRRLYVAESRGTPLPVLAVDVDMSSVAAAAASFVDSEDGRRQAAYWRGELAGDLPVLDLAAGAARPAARSGLGRSLSFDLSPKLGARLETLARARGTTLFTVLLAAYQVLLHRFSGQKDVIVGTPTSGRMRRDVAEAVGYFVNPVALRADFDGAPTFATVVDRMRRKVIGALAHADYPFPKLVEALQIGRDLRHTPIFQAMFAVEHARRGDEDLAPFLLGCPGATVSFGGAELSAIELEAAPAPFDVTLNVVKSGQALSGILTWNADVFDEGTALALIEGYEAVLGAVGRDPDVTVDRLPILSAASRQSYADAAAGVQNEVEGPATVHALFEAAVELSSDAVAVVCGQESWTYRQLNARANRIARSLIGQGAGPGRSVGVLLERSFDLVAALLGVLKSGAAYVPLDPSHPQARIAGIVADSGLELMVVDGAGRAALGATRVAAILDLSDAGGVLAAASTDDPRVAVAPDDLAYVIYTSGSTGKPKGVMIEHRSVVSLLHSMADEPGMDDGDTLVAVTTVTFDIAALELFLPLVVGARVVIADRDTVSDGVRLAGLLETSRATVMQATPATWRLLFDAGWSGSSRLRVLCGGEALPVDLARRLTAATRETWNVYGPTETTIWSMVQRVDPVAVDVTLGEPVAGTEIHVLDEAMEPVPFGVVGELAIGGVGLARGYHGRADLTAKAFIAHPFRPGARLYRTGDLARRRADGEIEFLGRRDHQVKIRGFRIELGEIEAALLATDGVRQAVCVARPFGASQRLVAYVVADGAASSAATLKTSLADRLPEWMLPQAFVLLDRLPLNTSGKIDRAALPEPTFGAADGRAEEEFLEGEEVVAMVFSEVLQVPRPGRDVSFFDLGGHSLLAVSLAARLRDTVQRDVAVRTIFENPTIRRLTAAIAAAAEDVDRTPVVRVPRGGPLEAGFGQERLWFIDQLEQGSAFYNIAAAFLLDGAVDGDADIDAEALAFALDHVVARHEALRTSFALEDGRPRQVIADSVPTPLTRVDLRGGGEDDVRRLARDAASRPFDLATAPLLRVLLADLGDRRHALVVVIHHAIADGWSLRLLVAEVNDAYAARRRGEAPTSPEPEFQYADFVDWQRRTVKGPALARQLEWWTSRLADAPAHLDLPTDRERPAIQTYRGARHAIHLSAAGTHALELSARRLGATPFMALLAAFRATLHAWTGARDIVIGAPIAGRQRREFERTIGFFLNTLALRGTVTPALSLADAVAREKEGMLAAFARPDVPFDRIVDDVVKDRDASRSPIFQVLFTLQVPHTLPARLLGTEARLLEIDTGATKFDIMLDLAQTPTGIRGAWIYNADLFTETTIARQVGLFERLVDAIAHRPETALRDIEFPDAAERARLLAAGCPKAPRPPGDLIHRMVEARVMIQPDAPALRFADVEITYGQLNARANRLAHRLIAAGVDPEARVGICLPRSDDLVVALLAVLKSGGAYVALDPGQPAARLAELVADCGLHLVVTRSDVAAALPENGPPTVSLDASVADLARRPTTDPLTDVGPENLAYVVFTSGSTGKPKGVMSRHRGVTNYLHYLAEAWKVGKGDVVLQVPAVTFDASVRDIFGTLTGGGLLVMVGETEIADARALTAIMERHGVTCIMAVVPTLLSALVDAAAFEGKRLPRLRLVIVSGEVLHRVLCDRTRAVASPDVTIVNQYGPTECTMTTTFHVVEATPGGSPRVPIGRPIANARVYVLDRDGIQTAIGVFGEIWIGGVGVARGYLGDDAQTAERFPTDPRAGVADARMYRTGDRGRFLADGTLEFAGRIDNQIKIRGFRVEPGEIEAQLKRLTGVREAAVIAKAGPRGDQRLVAYVVAERGVPPTPEALREALRLRLPDYMVPSATVLLESMPLTGNGKLDRKRLPDPESARQRGKAQAPTTASETAIAEVWAKILDNADIGVLDNFFDLGGHSLSSIEAIAGIHGRLGVRLAPRELMFQTLGQLARLCDERRTSEAPQPTKGKLAGLKDKLRGALRRGGDRNDSDT